LAAAATLVTVAAFGPGVAQAEYISKPPGVLMGQTGTIADGKHPIALTGRVWTWCDASAGAIQPGDLLTTSDVPGHAMKVTDRTRAQGAIIGKAMTSLSEGTGLVLVLVALQ
jgi:hypothetical protein